MLAAAGTTLGIAAASSFARTKQSPDAERLLTDVQAPFFRSEVDSKGIIHYEHPSGKQEISIMYTNHNMIVDPSLLPDTVTDVSIDTGGKNFQSGANGFIGKNALSHYKELGQHIIDQNIEIHLMCPAAPFSDNEDTTIPQGIDYGIFAFQSAIGALLTRDSIRELLHDIKSRRIEALQHSSSDNMIAWDILKGSGGVVLMEPVLAALARVQSIGKPDMATEAWLQSVFARNPQFITLLNGFIDLVHTIKVRQLMTDRARLDPQKIQHFQLVIGRTHVCVASGLEKPMKELFAQLDTPIMKAVLLSFGMTSPNVLTIPVSQGSRFEKHSGSEALQRRKNAFYPDLFSRLTMIQQQDLRHCYSSSLSNAIGNQPGDENLALRDGM